MEKLQDEQMPTIEMNYINVVMIFPKTLSANRNIFHLTIFFKCVHTHICVLLYFMKMWKWFSVLTICCKFLVCGQR